MSTVAEYLVLRSFRKLFVKSLLSVAILLHHCTVGFSCTHQLFVMVFDWTLRESEMAFRIFACYSSAPPPSLDHLTADLSDCFYLVVRVSILHGICFCWDRHLVFFCSSVHIWNWDINGFAHSLQSWDCLSWCFLSIVGVILTVSLWIWNIMLIIMSDKISLMVNKCVRALILLWVQFSCDILMLEIMLHSTLNIFEHHILLSQFD